MTKTEIKQEKRTAIIVAEVHVNAHFIRTEHMQSKQILHLGVRHCPLLKSVLSLTRESVRLVFISLK